jgi:hypothetical protein
MVQNALEEIFVVLTKNLKDIHTCTCMAGMKTILITISPVALYFFAAIGAIRYDTYVVSIWQE